MDLQRGHFLVKMYAKMKELGPIGGVCPACPPRSANGIYHLILKLGIWRCNGPERHEMLTVFNAYYGYCKILQVCHILH